MQIGFTGLLMLAALAWGFARVLDAPRWVERAIPLVLLLVMLASLIALPPEAPLRQSVSGALRAFVFLALAAVPILGYRWVLRRLRARRHSLPAAPAHPTGFVLIEDDTALTEDCAAAEAEENRRLVDWAPHSFSVAHRDEAGRINASARATLAMGLAEISTLRVSPEARGTGLGARLLGELEAEARRRGATRAALDTYDWQAETFCRRQGYNEYGRLEYPGGHDRIFMVKDLT